MQAHIDTGGNTRRGETIAILYPADFFLHIQRRETMAQVSDIFPVGGYPMVGEQASPGQQKGPRTDRCDPAGAVAGLVAITPASGYVDPFAALIIGLVAGLVCYWGAVVLKPKLGYDDSLDVFGVHGLGGITGALLTGVFAVEAIGGTPGLLEGNAGQVLIQLEGIGATIVYCAIVTFVLLKIIDAVMGLRVDEEEEVTGLDYSLHGETVQ